MVYLDEEVNGFHREDYYYAQIAAEVRRGIVKHPESVKVSQFLLKFRNEEENKQTPEEKMGDAKQFFSALTGMGKKAKVNRGKKK